MLWELIVIELPATWGLWYTTRLPSTGGRAAKIKEDALRIFISGLLAWWPAGRVSTADCRKSNIGPAGKHAAQRR